MRVFRSLVFKDLELELVSGDGVIRDGFPGCAFDMFVKLMAAGKLNRLEWLLEVGSIGIRMPMPLPVFVSEAIVLDAKVLSEAGEDDREAFQPTSEPETDGEADNFDELATA